MPDTNPLGELLAALETFGQHEPNCNGGLNEQCDCGLDEALAAFKAWKPWEYSSADRAVARAINVAIAAAEESGEVLKVGAVSRAALKALWEHLGLTP